MHCSSSVTPLLYNIRVDALFHSSAPMCHKRQPLVLYKHATLQAKSFTQLKSTVAVNAKSMESSGSHSRGMYFSMYCRTSFHWSCSKRYTSVTNAFILSSPFKLKSIADEIMNSVSSRMPELKSV